MLRERSCEIGGMVDEFSRDVAVVGKKRRTD